MSKKRKTKKEKMRAAIRQSTHPFDSTPVYSIETNYISTSTAISKEEVKPASIPATHYAYVAKDARRTFIVTAIILAASIVFYFTVQNHIINLAMLGY